MRRTARGKLEGGDTAWEEKNQVFICRFHIFMELSFFLIYPYKHFVSARLLKMMFEAKLFLSACTYSKLKFAESLLRDVICIVIIIHNYVEVDFNICRIGGNLENHCEYILQNILLH